MHRYVCATAGILQPATRHLQMQQPESGLDAGETKSPAVLPAVYAAIALHIESLVHAVDCLVDFGSVLVTDSHSMHACDTEREIESGLPVVRSGK